VLALVVLSLGANAQAPDASDAPATWVFRVEGMIPYTTFAIRVVDIR